MPKISIDEILRLPNEAEIVVNLSDQIQHKISKSGFASLTDEEKTFHYIGWLDAEVNNGGFEQYFFNSAGDHAQDAIEALKSVGAAHTARLVQEAMMAFPSGVAQRDRAERQNELLKIGAEEQKFLRGLSDKFYEDHDNLWALTIAFVRQQKDRFKLDQ